MRSQLKSSTSLSRRNFDAIRLLIEYIPPRSIAAGRQLRRHPKRQLAQICESIERIGFLVPLLVDENTSLVSGNARLAAAIKVGLDAVPIVRVSHLTTEQLRLFAIFENKVAEDASWDDEMLNLEFEELRIENPEIRLEDSGYAIGEIDALAGRTKTDALTDLDDVFEPEADYDPVSVLSDVWNLGRHRLICGDSTDPAVMAQLIEGRTVRQVVVDPPFDLPTRTFSSSKRHGDFAMGAGELGAGFGHFLQTFMEAVKPTLVDGALFYVFMDWRGIGKLLQAAEAAGLRYKQLLVWTKSTAGMGSFYRSSHELCAVFQFGYDAARNNIELGRFGRNRSNVLAYPGVMASKGRRAALRLHPTVKNLAMIADLILDASAPGEVIVDSFGGSGTTVIAAEKTDRTAMVCELSPAFVDVIINRFNALGGPQAVHVATGKSFDELALERRAGQSAESDND